jgi:charged multivesicular body protein 5
MFNRFFGKAKPKKPVATLDDASASIDKRGTDLDAKIKKMDEELAGFKKQMAKMKPGPARRQIEQRALR